MSVFGPLEFSLWLEILGTVFTQSGLPNEAQYSCRCNDSRWDLRRKVLNVVATEAGLPNTSQFFWRPGDSEAIVARKLLTAFGGSCVCGGDSLYVLYRKILEQVRLNSGNENVPAFAWRPNDSLLDILTKILNNLQNADPPEPPDPPFCCFEIGDYGQITAPQTAYCDYELVSEVPVCSDDWGSI